MRFRPYKPGDAEKIVTWVDEYTTFMKWSAGKIEYPLTVEILNDHIKAYEKDDRAWVFTMTDESGLPVGTITMLMADFVNNSIHFGFVAIALDQRNNGLGKQLMTLALRFAFEILNVTEATLKVFDNNPSAKACYEAVGFHVSAHHEKTFSVGKEKWGYYDMTARK